MLDQRPDKEADLLSFGGHKQFLDNLPFELLDSGALEIGKFDELAVDPMGDQRRWREEGSDRDLGVKGDVARISRLVPKLAKSSLGEPCNRLECTCEDLRADAEVGGGRVRGRDVVGEAVRGDD